MAEKKNEPQSYGSQSEWVRGDTGQQVNNEPGVSEVVPDRPNDVRERENVEGGGREKKNPR